MFAAAARRGVVLMEAYPYLSQPQTLKVLALIRANAIGELRLLRASFGFTIADPTNIRMNTELAGGALMDAGSYPVSLALKAMAQKPERVHAAARWAPSGVDASMLGTLEFPNGALAQISCSFETGVHRHALIAGTQGTIETTYQNHLLSADQAVIRLKRGTDWTTPVEDVHTAFGNGFVAEVETFRRLILDDSKPEHVLTPDESIAIAQTLDALRVSARSGRWEGV
jgi:D-xylose 1-dehydrogenase (NADP+, D-xylono-1,5-lactone-forming)